LLRVLLLVAVLLVPGARAQNVVRPSVKAAAPPALAPDARIVRDLPYVPNATARQRLDLFLPLQPGAPRPLVAWIHGGAWNSGSKDGCPARRLVPLGYAVASIEYRFSQDAPYPAQIEDCKAAIRWVRANAAAYGIDARRIGVWGGSAGGHLAALLGVTGHMSDFDTGPNLDQSSAVQCVVDFFGPTDFLHYGQVPTERLDGPASAAAQLIGGPISTHPVQARRASPVYFVEKDAAPFMIFHGQRDPIVPLQQSQELNAALKKAGVESSLRVIAGGGHGGPGFGTPENQALIIDFLDRHLKPRE
jgi:acetyl esterase/lipase